MYLKIHLLKRNQCLRLKKVHPMESLLTDFSLLYQNEVFLIDSAKLNLNQDLYLTCSEIVIFRNTLSR